EGTAIFSAAGIMGFFFGKFPGICTFVKLLFNIFSFFLRLFISQITFSFLLLLWRLSFLRLFLFHCNKYLVSCACTLHILFVRHFKFLLEEFIMVGVCYALFFVLFNSHAWLLLLKCHGELILSAHLFNLFICL